MRKLLFVGIMFLCVSFANAQEDYEVKEVLIPTENEKGKLDDDLNEYLDGKFGDAAIGDIIMVMDTTGRVQKQPKEEVAKTPTPTPETKTTERSNSSRKVTSSGSSSSSSTRKSSSRKRTKRKKVSLKRKRPKRMKRKRKLGRRAVCPTF